MNPEKLIKVSVFIMLTGFLAFFFFFLSTYLAFDPNNLKFLSSLGEPKITTDTIKFEYITLEKVPLNCKNSFISTEDKTFNSNIGVELGGLARLFISGITNGNYGGGSTISQQVIKISEESIFNRGAFNKVFEIIEAVKLNQVWTKEHILETYLNNIYLGNFNYGIESASRDYFGKSTSNLGLAECAYLAGLTQSPETYSPYKNLPLGINRQKTVLTLMFLNKLISESQYATAITEELKFSL